MYIILIGIGANLPMPDGTPALQTCLRAADTIRHVAALHQIHLSKMQISRWYETSPIPPSGQPLYVNGVAEFHGNVEPAALLEILHEIEGAHGRQRSVANAARMLDLDIIAMGDLVRAAPDPVLPHPRMHERAFVLQPLLDVAPDWRHPVLGVTARALLEALPPQHVRVLASSHLRDGAATPN